MISPDLERQPSPIADFVFQQCFLFLTCFKEPIRALAPIVTFVANNYDPQ
jgi:hypothetical protein